jgi:hypothetical protein
LLSALAEDGVLGIGFFCFREALSHYELSLEDFVSLPISCCKHDSENYSAAKRRFVSMRQRAVIAGLVLLTIVFCLASQSQATYYNRRNIRHFDQVVGEHPWQESGVPINDDTDSKLTISRIFIVIGSARIIIIKNPLNQKATLIEDDNQNSSTATYNGT